MCSSVHVGVRKFSYGEASDTAFSEGFRFSHEDVMEFLNRIEEVLDKGQS